METLFSTIDKWVVHGQVVAVSFFKTQNFDSKKGINLKKNIQYFQNIKQFLKKNKPTPKKFAKNNKNNAVNALFND